MWMKELVELVRAVDEVNWSTKLLFGFISAAFVAGIFVF